MKTQKTATQVALELQDREYRSARSDQSTEIALDLIKKQGEELLNNPPVWHELPPNSRLLALRAKASTRIEELRGHVTAYEAYCATVNALHDRHGVIDAQCEMRELEARIDELERLLK